jgi:hypothetical protein
LSFRAINDLAFTLCFRYESMIRVLYKFAAHVGLRVLAIVKFFASWNCRLHDPMTTRRRWRKVILSECTRL